MEFDSYTGEAFFLDHMPATMDLLASRNLVKTSQGAEIVDLTEHNMPPVMLRKTDGATLYITRDIAAAIHRKANYGFDRCLYVVDNGQSLHFQQLIKVLELAGFDWYKGVEHVPFGLVLIKSEEGGWEKGKTRSGQSSLLKDVIEGAQEKILGIIREKNPDAVNKEGLALQIGVGALVFSELKNRRLNDIRFEWDKALELRRRLRPLCPERPRAPVQHPAQERRTRRPQGCRSSRPTRFRSLGWYRLREIPRAPGPKPHPHPEPLHGQGGNRHRGQ